MTLWTDLLILCACVHACVCAWVCWQVGDLLPNIYITPPFTHTHTHTHSHAQNNYTKQYKPIQRCTYVIQATIIIIQLTTHCTYTAKVSIITLVNLTVVNSVSIQMVLQCQFHDSYCMLDSIIHHDAWRHTHNINILVRHSSAVDVCNLLTQCTLA